ncbi:hypothetical protein [Sulfoacidibacillus thermotolerans]|uniref:hypothetical protein n=1 Tax=Sulfoacidibacillus thermotolerans TaxID=1765684 RepID=UPI0015E81BD4|nr:hypothetical protein [Sulfoacidibacillus thermotolerans]
MSVTVAENFTSGAVLFLDYSSKSLYVDSEGTQANYSKFYRQEEAKLTKEQRKLSEP